MQLKSAFREWFVEQFGDRSTEFGSDATLRDVVSRGKKAKAELHKRAQWDAKFDAALTAWQVPDDHPNK